MGSMNYHYQKGVENTLKEIINGEYKFVVVLSRLDEASGKILKGGYELFREFDEEAMKGYALKLAADNNFKLSKIEVLSLNSELKKEIKT